MSGPVKRAITARSTTPAGETPYIRALRIMSHIVKNFDDDDIYPVYRFGCLNTKDQSVLPLLYPEQDDPHFEGFADVCQAYNRIASQIEMSGPTTFCPNDRTGDRDLQGRP